MSKINNNYHTLHDNKYKLLAYVKKIIAGTVAPLPTKTSQQIIQLLKHQQYGELIQALNQDKDNSLGIIWYIKDDLGNGTGALVRDARNQTHDKVKLERDAPQKYMMQLVNKSRGAIDLINLTNTSLIEKEVNIKKIHSVLEEALQYIDNLGILNIIEYNTQILEILIDLKIKDAPEILQFAREISNFKDTHYHITTLSRVSKAGEYYDVVEAEIMLNGYTSEQREQYNKIASYNPSKNNYVGVEWFDLTKSKLKKQLMHQHLNFIREGKKVIPTQLIYSLTSIRNAYMKVTAIKDLGIIKIIAENIHCGTPSNVMTFLSEKAQIAVTVNNIRQLSTYISPNSDLNLSSLNSRTPYDIRGENFTVDQVRAVKNMNILPFTLSVTPVNKWRLIGGGRNQKSFQNILNMVCQIIKSHGKYKVKVSNIIEYLQNNNYPILSKFIEIISLGYFKSIKTKALDEIKVLENSVIIEEQALSKILKTSISAKTILENRFPTYENTDLILVNKIYMLENSIKLPEGYLNNLLTENSKLRPIINVTFCKSGKDRTGYVMFVNTVSSVNEYLDIEQDSTDAKNNRQIIAHSGHVQEMAGIQGGTIGCHSLKMMSEFHLDQLDQELRPILAQSSSQLNNKINILKNSNNKFRAIRDFLLNI
ncbi:MAG: hypothetical protein H6909_01185 [Rickettsiaceae bacterium]|nr:hypothetical protein [Rickettsiaceae bacterium]